MGAPATGNALLLGLARELEEGIPNETATYDFFRPVLPATLGLTSPINPGGEVNASGFLEPGVPGAVAGALDFGSRMSAAALLRVIAHLFRDITKTEVETGVFEYVCVPDRTAAEKTLFALLGLSPVDQERLYGVKLSGVVAAIGNNTPIAARIAGQALHHSRYGAAVADAGNTGTWAGAPVIRGELANAAAGNLFVEATAVSPALKFKLKQAVGTTPPTMSGTTEITQAYDPTTLRAVYQMGLTDGGVDIGIMGENKDPLEIVFPGLASEHVDIAPGDTWYFPVSWDLPTVTAYVAGQRFTSAHQANRVRPVGGSTWTEIRTQTANLSLLWPIAPDGGSGSKYPFAIDRPGILTPTLQLVRRHRDMTFQDAYRRKEALEVQTYFEGQQLASGPYRESIKIDWENCFVLTAPRPAQNADAVIETVQLQGHTNAASDPPLTVTVVTDEDFDIA